MKKLESPNEEALNLPDKSKSGTKMLLRKVDLMEKGSSHLDPEKPTQKAMNPIVWQLMLLFGVFIYGTYTIFVHLCEVDGKIPFSSASMVLVTEIIKLCLSIAMFIPEYKEKGFQMPPLKFALPYAVPAILYCMNNNIAVHMQLEMDPASYQVLGNLKILSTAFLYRLIIKRPITAIQWVALALLATAGACNSYGGLQAADSEKSAGVIHVTVKGLMMISCYCFISGLAGVYTEYILKGKYETSIHIQNGLLYTFGIMLNLVTFFLGNIRSDEKDSGIDFFRGFTHYTWILILTQAVSGLIMSAIMKHGSNITRLFLISCAMLVTTLLSMLIFSLKLNVFFMAAFILVVIALFLYHRK